MYDLETLQYLNEQAVIAHERAVERAKEAAQESAGPAPAPSIPVYPLADLARRLIFGPLSLAYLIQLFENSEYVAAFLDLVQQFLPSHEEEIRMADADERISLFCRHFEREYFPLNFDMYDYEENELAAFLREIPVELRGFSYDDFHGFADFRTGLILLLSIVESPFWHEDGHGGRIPILSYVSDLFGQDIAGLIPIDGWGPTYLHNRTDETRFDGVGACADWVHSQTGCWVLDANYYDYNGEDWSEQTVSALAEQWPEVIEIQNKINRIYEFIETNPKKRFLELLNLLLDINTSDFIVPDEQLPLPLFDRE